MSYTAYSSLYPLAEFSFIAGTEYVLDYTVYEADGVTPIDLSSASFIFYASPYGQPDYVAISVNGVLGIDPGTVTVTLLFADTANLRGKFVQQPTIVDFFGKEYRLGQGVFTIIPKISE